MCDCSRRGFIWGVAGFGAAVGLATGAVAAEPAEKPKVYTCPPCGCPNDGKEFPAAGDCSYCAMPLVEKPPAPQAQEKPPAK